MSHESIKLSLTLQLPIIGWRPMATLEQHPHHVPQGIDRSDTKECGRSLY